MNYPTNTYALQCAFVLENCKGIIKGDMDYRGDLAVVLKSCFGFELLCVKSNFGTSEFRPIDGRWVVERTFAWLDTFRRLCRNYEHYLQTARGMTIVAFVMQLLRRP